jgi:hypothetical protein
MPRSPSRFALRSLLASAAALSIVAGCATPRREEVRTVGLNRETPRAAYEYLKAMVRAEQPEAEWKVFSPAFKRRLSERVGRTIDVGDYVQARSTIATNSRPEIRRLLDSEFVSERVLSEKIAVVQIRGGDQQARPRFVKLTTWELKLRGEGEPVAEFVPNTSDVISISPTGQVEMKLSPSEGTASFLRDVRQDQIRSFSMQEYWYLDDFGGVESVVLGGLRGEQDGTTPPAPARGRRPQPPRDAPPAPPPPPADPLPPGGFGSPG